MRPIIGVTPSIRELTWAGGLTMPAAVGWSSYSRAVAAAGGVPVLLPPDGQGVDEVLAIVDGLLLSGGADLDPARYGEVIAHPTVYGIDADRDAFELALTRGAVAHDLPLLAVCRGIQVLNVALGGTLYQDVPDQHPAHQQHSQAGPPSEPHHPIRLAQDSCLARIYQTTIVAVNSFHHQAVKTLPPELRAVGWAPEGLVEGVERPGSAFCVGVQWHPEAMFTVHVEHQRPFAALVAAAGARRGALSPGG